MSRHRSSPRDRAAVGELPPDLYVVPDPWPSRQTYVATWKLDNLVAGDIKDRLLQPERLEEILASVLDRRQERTERRREHIAELTRRSPPPRE
jgi:hypothetical protein